MSDRDQEVIIISRLLRILKIYIYIYIYELQMVTCHKPIGACMLIPK